jgi:acetyltransferase-like isoleucine patch superfamily enzyme
VHDRDPATRSTSDAQALLRDPLASDGQALLRDPLASDGQLAIDVHQRRSAPQAPDRQPTSTGDPASTAEQEFHTAQEFHVRQALYTPQALHVRQAPPVSQPREAPQASDTEPTPQAQLGNTGRQADSGCARSARSTPRWPWPWPIVSARLPASVRSVLGTVLAEGRRRVELAAGELLHRAAERVFELGTVGHEHAVARRFGSFGEGSMLAFPPGTHLNEHAIAIGRNTMIGPFVTLSAGMAKDQRFLFSPVVRIGDRCVIGRGSHIVGHLSIEIGDDVQTGPYVYVTDQNHVYDDPDVPIGVQWPAERGVVIGSGSWLGAGVVVLPGARIGRNVAIGAGSVVVGEIPDRSVAVGVPAKVVRRYHPERGWERVDANACEGSSGTHPHRRQR